MMEHFTVHLVSWHDAEPLLRAVREEVFMREQGVSAELEWDGMDDICHHVLALNKHGEAIGCGRITPHDTTHAHIGRMAVLPDWRGKQVGSAILEALLEYAYSRHYSLVELNAQTHAAPFYRRFGFVALGEEFMDAEMPHIRMQLHLE